ncbi:MAG: ATP-dependent zinc metalloprotease FtsH [Armatimonadota bacterium]|nr:MAG: ATP-dependent zinc metalloprotease FtsH [Armatimonadota bacterium]
MNGTRFLKLLFWVGLFVGLLAAGKYLANKQPPQEKLAASEFLNRIAGGQVASAMFRKDIVTGDLRNNRRFVVWLPESDREQYVAALHEAGIDFGYDRPAISESLMSSIIMVVIVVLLMVGFWMFIMRQAQSGSSQALSFGRSRAKRITEGMPKITFSDVAGVEEAKEELEEVVDFLRNAKRFQTLGARIPRGVLLLGPPGCGKTLLARAVAGEAGVPFFHISGSDFVEMFVGVGASRVRDLFEQAKANRPCIVFIDEIDAVGRQRFAGLGGGHDEREPTLNQLLVEMDGFDPNAGVILVAATNRPDVLDPALLRPGRFDRRIVVDQPDIKGRRDILAVHVKGKPLADDVDLEVLARRTPGFSGADLANMANEGALLAARGSKTKIEMVDFEASVDRVIAGPERKSRIISEAEKRILAHHEVGHAVLAELLPHADPLHKTSILARGMALGYTLQLPLEDKYVTTRSELLDDITVLLGGRAAERIVFAEPTTGATNDLERATELARRMVTEFGMSDKLGARSFGRKHGMPFLGRDLMDERDYSDDVASAIDHEIRAIIDQSYHRAEEILRERRSAMERIVQVLLEKETLERDEFKALLEDRPLPESESAGPSPPGGEAVKPETHKEEGESIGPAGIEPSPA